MERYQGLTDLFTVTCKQCGSTDVDLYGDSCSEWGNFVNATCNNCESKYDYYEFKTGEFNET